MASRPSRSRSRSRDDTDVDPPRRADPEREQLLSDLDDLERWKETGALPPGYDSNEQLERDLAEAAARLTDGREPLPPGYDYLPTPPPRRFQRSDRVVCSLGGGFGWLPGAVQSINEPNPHDPRDLFPYLVKLDPPLGKLISVPEDKKNFCRSEICFDGDVPGGAEFSIACLPLNPTKQRRFGEGDFVCVAVEDPEDVHTDWAAGEVIQVDVDVGAASKIPYRVRLAEDRYSSTARSTALFTRGTSSPRARGPARRASSTSSSRGRRKPAPGRRSTTRRSGFASARTPTPRAITEGRVVTTKY